MKTNNNRYFPKWHKILFFIYLFVFLIGLSIYAYDIFLINDFNNFVSFMFYGIKVKSILAQKYHGTGEYYKFMAGFSMIATVLSLPIILFIISSKNLWCNKQIAENKKNLMYILLFLSIALWYLFYFIQPISISKNLYDYSFLDITVTFFCLNFALAITIMSMIDILYITNIKNRI